MALLQEGRRDYLQLMAEVASICEAWQPHGLRLRPPRGSEEATNPGAYQAFLATRMDEYEGTLESEGMSREGDIMERTLVQSIGMSRWP